MNRREKRIEDEDEPDAGMAPARRLTQCWRRRPSSWGHSAPPRNAAQFIPGYAEFRIAGSTPNRDPSAGFLDFSAQGAYQVCVARGRVNFWRQRRHRFFGNRRSSLSKNGSRLRTPPRTTHMDRVRACVHPPERPVLASAPPSCQPASYNPFAPSRAHISIKTRRLLIVCGRD